MRARHIRAIRSCDTDSWQCSDCIENTKKCAFARVQRRTRRARVVISARNDTRHADDDSYVFARHVFRETWPFVLYVYIYIYIIRRFPSMTFIEYARNVREAKNALLARPFSPDSFEAPSATNLLYYTTDRPGGRRQYGQHFPKRRKTHEA